MFLIVSSRKDIASTNIKKQILAYYDFRKKEYGFQGNPVYKTDINGKKIELVTLNEQSAYAQNITDFFPNCELIVFVSRHSSASGLPTLSVHTPGNLFEAEFGGLSMEVSVSPANAMKDALKAMMRLKDEMQLEYDVSYECTHHGPSLTVPTMFVELGSSPKQWKDSEASKVVAQATVEAVLNFGSFPTKAVIGIGGPHYNHKFTKIALENDLAFGHMIPKYVIPNIDLNILKQCLQRTCEKVELAVLDWKGIKGKHKSKVVEILREAAVFFKKI